MIGYTLLGSNDLPRAKAFYDELLALFGAKRAMGFDRMQLWASSGPMLGVCTPYDGGTASPGNGTMVSLAANTRAQVDAVHAKALALGGTDEGAPGVRGDDPDGFYGAYFRDLDGNKLCIFRVGPAG